MTARSTVTYGLHQVVGTHNEDRGCAHVNKPTDDQPLFAAFAVFDGHYGSLAASASAQHLHNTVTARFSALSAHPLVKDDGDSLLPQEKLDACFCEAMKSSCLEMDENIHNSDKSGTCMQSVMCMLDPVDGAVRIYFSSVGDSRTVVFGNRFSAIDPVADASTHSQEEMNHSHHSDFGGEVAAMSAAERRKMNKQVRAYAVCEDHTLQLPRERERVESQDTRLDVSLWWHPLPAEVMCEVGKTDPRFQSTMFTKDQSSVYEVAPSLFELGYPNSKLQAAADLIRDITADPAVSDVVAFAKTTYRSSAKEEEDLPVYELQHQISFVDKRDPKAEREFLFSRYNLSAMMTRTIGDVFGPRSCIPLPDIAALTVKPNEFARIVIASDGMWDVMTVETVRRTVMKFWSPEDVAVALAQSASNLRTAHSVRKDDITVIVVDVNHGLYGDLYQAQKCVIL